MKAKWIAALLLAGLFQTAAADQWKLIDRQGTDYIYLYVRDNGPEIIREKGKTYRLVPVRWYATEDKTDTPISIKKDESIVHLMLLDCRKKQIGIHAFDKIDARQQALGAVKNPNVKMESAALNPLGQKVFEYGCAAQQKK